MDEILKLALTGALVGTVMIAPNALIGLDKPMKKAFDALDKREREREIARVLAYMKSKKLLAENYQNGLEITTLGQLRLKRMDYEKLSIPTPEVWDGQWRIIMFDIPEEMHRTRRDFTAKLRLLGYKYLQQSVWIHPFESRREISVVCEKLNISKYVTYIVTTHIDHESVLIDRFKTIFQSDSK